MHADQIATHLREAGAHELSPSARRWLAGRLALDATTTARGGIIQPLAPNPDNYAGIGVNVGLVESARLGARGRLAAYPDLDTAARALVADASRAGATSDEPAEDIPLPEPDATPGVGGEEAPAVGWLPGFGPSDEAQAGFAALRADWESFIAPENGGPARFLTGDEKHRREDLFSWRTFRHAWESGDLDSTEIGGQLRAQIAVANEIRRELAETAQRNASKARAAAAVATDETERAARLAAAAAADKRAAELNVPIPDVNTIATNAARAAEPVDTFAKNVPGLDRITSPKQNPADAALKITTGAIAIGGTIALAVLIFYSKIVNGGR